MIIVDNALHELVRAGKRIRVGMVGAGFMAEGIAEQLIHHAPGIELVAIANRTPQRAEQVLREAGVESLVFPECIRGVEEAVEQGRTAVTDDASLICASGNIDLILEATGTIEHAAGLVLMAMKHGKDVILMNAELDGTVGPILKRYADKQGVIYSACDGDQPGVEMNLFRYVKSMGFTPLVCGNIKGLQDAYRNPTTQAEFAERWGQKPRMVTSFADGTKMSFEQAIVANGTNFSVAKRGMNGWEFKGHVDELTGVYDPDELRALGGIVDYVVGAKPLPGVYVIGAHDHPKHRRFLQFYKMGDGPLYSFYTPYHLCHFEIAFSVARVALFRDAVLSPAGPPRVDVVATAKIDLEPGTVLDGIGGYHVYGQCEDSRVVIEEDLLPIGLCEGARITKPISRDSTLTRKDVALGDKGVSHRLREEQDEYFFGKVCYGSEACEWT